MKNLPMKHVNTWTFSLCLVLASAAGSACFADTLSVDSSLKAQINEKKNNQDAIPSLSQPTIVSCPAEFQQVKISNDARQCQAFEKDTSAVMVYHSPRTPREVLGVYETAHPSLKPHSPVRGRTLLSSEDKTIRVIISPDNAGSQVDILVTSKTH